MNYSPLRYPGGKARLASYIKLIISGLETRTDRYIEPFAGGAGVALDLLLTGTVKEIIINDYDKAVYSFWRAILEETGQLVELIKSTEVTVDEWYKQRDIYNHLNSKYSLELAFATFFLNRTNRSGILNAGPIGGYAQNGNYLIDARYNKEILIEKILKISKYKKNIKVYNKEIRTFIKQIVSQYGADTFTYFDPPYFEKGYRLYKNSLSLQDHAEIADHIKKYVTAEWIITYDDVDDIKKIYVNDYFRTYEWAYSIVKRHINSEIIIFKHRELCPVIQQLDDDAKIRLI